MCFVLTLIVNNANPENSLTFTKLTSADVANPKILEIIMKTNLEKDDLMLTAHDLFGNGSIYATGECSNVQRAVYSECHVNK